MNRRHFHFAFILTALLLATLACNFSASTANIDDAWLAHDKAGEQPTKIFFQDETFYCIVELANAPEDTIVKVVWAAVQAEGEAPNTFLYESELTSGSSTLYYELSNDYLWPTGKYKAEIYLDGDLDRTLDFEVYALETNVPAPAPQEPTQQAPAPQEPTAPPSDGIRNAYTSRDEDGTQPTTVFTQNEIFYAIVEVLEPDENMTVESAWYAVQAEGVEPNYLIDTAQISGAYDTFTFNLSNDQLWPLGTYKVEIYLNGTLARTLEFSVQ